MRLGFWCAALLATGSAMGCSDSAGGDGDFMDDDLPMGGCGSGTGSCPETTGNVPAGLPCSASFNCDGDLTCVAPFVDDAVGQFVCTAQCIGLEDEAWWCLDASACCDADAVCSPRGLCVLDATLDGTAESGSGDATMASGSESGSGDGATTQVSSSDSGEDSGSTTDATTSSTGGN